MGRFLLGLIIGVALTWFYFQGNFIKYRSTSPPSSNSTASSRPLTSNPAQTNDLKSAEIRDEIAKTGKVIREKVGDVGGELGDAAITAVILGKYAVDPNLSPRQIKVTTEKGVVTLNGEAATPELIHKAIEMALETKGVHKVISNLQILSPTSNSTDVPPRHHELPE